VLSLSHQKNLDSPRQSATIAPAFDVNAPLFDIAERCLCCLTHAYKPVTVQAPLDPESLPKTRKPHPFYLAVSVTRLYNPDDNLLLASGTLSKIAGKDGLTGER